MGSFFSLLFGQLWREWLIIGLMLIILVLGVFVYHRGYDHCEAAVNNARQEEQINALTQQDAYQAAASKIINDEKQQSAALKLQLEALQKDGHKPCPISSNAINLYNTDIH